MNIIPSKYRLLAGETQTVNSTANFIYCTKSSGLFEIQLLNGSSFEFKKARKIKFSEPIHNFYIKNNTDKTIDIELLHGTGDYSDDSTQVEGVVEAITSAKRYRVITSPQEVTIGSQGFAVVNPFDYSFCRIQNIGKTELRLYGENGFVLQPNGVEEMQLYEAFKIYGSNGSKFIFGGFNE